MRSTASVLAIAAAALSSAAERAQAACTPTLTPTTGQTVTCDSSQPNPVTTGIVAQPGSSNVTVNMLSGAQLNVGGGDALVLGGGGQVNNNSGAIIQGLRGLNFTGPGIISNSGQIGGNGGPGVILNGPGNSTLNNTGQIGGSGAAVQFNTVAGSSQTFNNTGNGSINGNFVGAGDGQIVIVNGGNFNGGITISGNGINSITTQQGRNINGQVSISGNAQTTILNGGAFNNGLTINGAGINTITNQAGAFINQVFSVTGIQNTIDNVGTLNNGLTVAGGGVNSITNRAGATINQVFTVTGSENTIDNAGTLNNGLTVGNGVNTVTNRSGATVNQTFSVSGTQNTVSNAGTVNSAVTVSGNGVNSITNSAGGLINQAVNVSGDAQSTITNSGTIQGGIRLSGNGTSAITNFGTINQGVFSSGSGSLFNSGTITASGSTAIDFTVSPGTGPFTLTLAPGFNISGNVLGNGSDTFQLGDSMILKSLAGTFDVSTIGPAQQYRGFSVFNKIGASVWTLTGTGAQNWNISGGVLIGDTNSLQGPAITNNAALVFSQNFTGTYAGSVGGTGTLRVQGGGTVIFTGANTYTGGTTINGATLQLGDGGASGSIAGDVVTNGTFAINRSDTVTFGNAISGTGAFVQAGLGTTILTANNGYSGPTTVSAGTLRVAGSIAGSSGVTVNAGATLAGTGTVTGRVASTTINDGGTLAPGDNAVGALIVAGNLVFQSAASYLVQVSPNIASTTFVTGSTTVAGTLTANDVGGAYTVNRIFTVLSSTGPLTGTFSSLAPIGGFSGATLSLAYSPNDVFLIITAAVTAPPAWKAVPGTSDWNTGTNWTTNTVPTAADIAEFNTSTITTIDIQQPNTQVAGLQFNAGAPAYTFNVTGTGGGASSLVILGDGVADISGNAPTFVVSGVAGGLGTLQFSNSSTAGDAVIITNAFGQTTFSGNSTGGLARFITNGGGVVDFSGTSGSAGNNRITVGSIEGAGTYNLGSNLLITGLNGLSTTVSGTINDGGASGGTGASLVKVGDGTLILSGNNTYTGLTAVLGGTLQLGDGGASGSILGNVFVHTTFAINRSDTYTFGGLIVGDGAFVQMGPGTTILTANNTYAGGTTISAGTLQLGNGGTSGGILGDVLNNGTLAVNRSDILTLSGVISGTGAFEQNGTGTTIFTADHTYGGGTTINAGTLQLGDGGTSGSITGNVLNNGTFAVNRSDVFTFGGVISGTGVVAQIGPGTTILTAANSYSGGTVVNAGILAVAADANLGAATGGLTFAGGTLQFLSGFGSNRAVTLNAGGGTFDTNGNDAALAGAIGGTGGLTKTGAGTLTLAGNNSYIGGTSLQQGTLQLASDNALGTGALTTLAGVVSYQSGVSIGNPIILNSNTTQFDVAFGVATQAGTISQTGGARPLEKIGNGALILTGANSYTGGTTVSAGTLQLGTSGTQAALAGPITVAALPATLSIVNADVSAITSIVNNGLTEFLTGTTAGSIAIANNRTLDFSGNASAGNATITTGTDSLTRFFETSTAGNATIVNNDFVQLTETATAGAATVTNNATFVLFDSSTAGTANFTNTGQLTFQASSSAANAVINNTGGEVFFTGTSTAANATITNAAGGSIAFFDAASGGNAVIINDGFFSISGLTSAGTTVGSIGGSGDISLGEKNLTFGSLNTNTEISGVIFGEGGSLTKVGTGTTILSGDNEYTGGTTISGGVLQLGNGGTTGSILGDVVNNATLAFNRSNAYQFDGVISGTGAVTQIGAGVTTLTANHSYTGPTTVVAGGLIVNGSIASSSSLTVNSGAFAGGTGTLPSTVVTGTLSPGNSIGTVTIGGSLTFGAASTYQVEVSPTAADRTNVTGIASLAGTVQAIPLAGSFRSQTYTILNAGGGISGTFGSLIVTGTFAPGARNPHLVYDANNVFLALDPSELTPQLPAGVTVNQRAVANAIDSAVAAGATPPAAFDVLLNLSGPAALNALTQLSGEVATGTQQAGLRAVDLFLGVMLNPFLHGRGETAMAGGPALAFAPEQPALPRDATAAYAAFLKAPAAPADTFQRRWSIWGSAYGGTSKSDGDAVIGSHDTRANAYGFAAGVDHRFSPNTLIGFALAGGGTHWSLASGLGTGRSDMFQAGVYGSHRFAGSAYVSAALAYTWHEASTTRDITLPGLGQLRADFHAQSFGARAEGGYRFATPWLGVTPYGALQALSVRTPNYTETGSPGVAAFALSYTARTVTATRSELGLWFDRTFWTAPDAALTLRSRAAWAHDFNTDRNIAATFQTLPLASFTVTGASPAQDFALISAAAELRLRNGWSFAAKGDAELAGRTQTYSGTGVLRYAW